MMRLSIAFMALLLCCAGCKQRENYAIEGLTDTDEVVRIASKSDPQSLDPRQVRDLGTVTVLNMLYEGLMRLDGQGRPASAIAKEITVSPDNLTYTIQLRESKWSNNDPLTAHDFARTWLSMLEPTSASPHAYQLYFIKGAKDAKAGKQPLSSVGITVQGDLTIVVELEHPVPYFEELLCTRFFYPVHQNTTPENPIGNGPFKLHSWKRHDRLVAVKNPNYWNKHEVRLDGIVVMVMDEKTALQLFENGELDWAGSPMSTLPQDAIEPLKKQHKLRIAPAAGTQWFRLNTGAVPFTSEKMRRAFALALDRKALVTHVTQGNQRAAEAIVPPSFGLNPKSYFEDHNVTEAWTAYQEGLKELDISKDELPEITLCYAAGDRNQKIAQAVQQQWVTALGIEVKLTSCEGTVLFDRLSKHQYQIASGGWYADFRDPYNFLEIFQSKENATNNTQWEDERYTQIISASAHEADPRKRAELLSEAQGILMQQMPVAPLFYNTYNYVKDESLVGSYFSDLGYIDFTYAFFGE